MKKLDATEFGLSPRTELFRSGKKIIIQKNRKSRVIMQDGKKILEMAEKIRTSDPSAQIVFKTNAPVCSKTLPFLEENGVKVSLSKE